MSEIKKHVRTKEGFKLPVITEAKRAEIKAKKEAWIADNYSPEYQLGLYIGNYIVDRFLPTLSTDMIRSRTVINVTEEEKTEYERLDSIWYNLVSQNSEKMLAKNEWNALQVYRKKLDNKYLPPVLECYVTLIRVSEDKVLDLKKGIRQSLWDCDMCSYKCDPDDIEMSESGWHTILKFPLDDKLYLQ